MATPSEAPLNGAIIGCGFFGSIQMDAWRRMPEAKIVAACDPDLERAAKAAPRAYASAEELFAREKLDFVDIATRPSLHLPLVRLAAEARVPIICQKPMALDWNDAVAMVEICAQAGVPLMIHENWRWQPWYRAAHSMVTRGDVGRPIRYTFTMRRNDGAGGAPYPLQPYFKEMPRLLIYEALVHPIDTAIYLFGEVRQVYAQVRKNNPVIAAEDDAIIVLTHASGLHGVVDGHRFANAVPDGPAMGDQIVEGDAGVLRICATGDVSLGGQVKWRNPPETGYRGDSVRRTQEHFIACLKSGQPFESGGREYLHTFAAVEACYRSASERRAVAISEIYPG
jgi:predicted dehydrogenase